jgi:hypothetical protein
MSSLGKLRPATLSRRASAYHEAAHAVVGLRLGLKLVRVAIGLKKRNGRLEHGHVTFARGRMDPMRDGMMTMAGTAAEQKWHRMPKSRFSSGDWRYLEERRGYKPDSILTLLALARAQVDRHAEAIELVAGALLSTGKMTGRQVAAVLRAYDVDPRFPSH